MEREETLRRESKQRKAEDDAQIQLKKLAEQERDDMCEAMWTMNLSHKRRVAAAMARTHERHLRKEAWLRERERREAAERGVAPATATASLAASTSVVDGSSHWGEPGRGSPVIRQRQQEQEQRRKQQQQQQKRPRGKESDAQTTGDDESSWAEPVLKKARGEWTAAAVATGKDGGGRSHGGGGGGGVGAPSIQGLRFNLKGKARGRGRGRGRAPPPLPAAMAQAAAIAEAKEEKLVAAESVTKSPGAQPMDIESSESEPTAADAAAAATRPPGKPKASSSTSDSAAAAAAGPVTPAVVNNGVTRAKLSCSRLLLASDGGSSGVKLQRAICSDPRLVKMHWDGGLVLVTAVVRDAAGGKGLPGIGLTQGPAELVIEALGVKITIAAPPEARNGDGFAAACEGGVNSVRELREHMRTLDGHIEEHARGGDESLRWVDNLREKREVLRQVGGLLEEDDFRYLPALGGVWMAAYHRPSAAAAAARNGPSGVWKTGSATPSIEFRVLMRRARLASDGGLTVEEDNAYAEEAAAATAAAVLVAAESSGGEEGGGEGEGGGGYISTPMDHLRALEEQIYDGQVREVVSGALDGMVQKVMVRGLKDADLQDVIRWQAEEHGRSLAKAKSRGVEKPSSRLLDL